VDAPRERRLRLRKTCRLCLLLVTAPGACAVPARAQVDPATVRALRAVADGVLRDATFDFTDSATGHRYTAPEDAPTLSQLSVTSTYNDWRYWNGVLNLAMLRAADALHAASYADFVRRSTAFAFDHAAFFAARYAFEDTYTYPFAERFEMLELDDYGAESASLIELAAFDRDPRYRPYVDSAAAFATTRQARLPDGTLARYRPRPMTVWADDLFMSVPFLARMAVLTGDRRYLDDAVRQVLNFHSHLFDARSGLMYHNWYSDGGGRPGAAFWGRANGWALMAQVELLDRLPPGHPQRDTLVALFRRHVAGLARYQDTTGLWHQLLDRSDSFLETSASAMFTYAIARGVERGYLDSSWTAVARRGWAGVLTRIRPDGQIEGTCAGTGVSDDLADYYRRPTPLNDAHGVGPVLLAGLEILRLGR